MSKIIPLLNGESATLTDAMVANMDGRAMRSREFVREDWTDKVGKLFSCDVDHMYASVNDDQPKDREIHNLKELLFVHLDLIQRQSEIILSRDKEIAALREERDTLRQRFQRMERRVTLQKQKDEHPSPSSNPPQSVLVEPSSVPTLLVSTLENPTNLIPEPITKRRRISTLSSSRRKSRTISTGSDKTKLSGTSESNDADRRARARLHLTSDNEYYTAVGDLKEVWGPLDLRVPVEDLSQIEEQVQVPSWREKILSPLYVIEGTENLEDEVFLKRHHKLESDERRRKRWDIQRIREQTHVEKLKQRVLKGRGSSMMTPAETQITSFFPTQDDVQEISVEPSLPVVAFGLPLRVFDPCEFSLSWSAMTGHKEMNLRQR